MAGMSICTRGARTPRTCWRAPRRSGPGWAPVATALTGAAVSAGLWLYFRRQHRALRTQLAVLTEGQAGLAGKQTDLEGRVSKVERNTLELHNAIAGLRHGQALQAHQIERVAD